MYKMPKKYKTSYGKTFSFYYDFMSDKEFFLKRKGDLICLVKQLITREMEKQTPFEDMEPFHPALHFPDAPLIEERLRLFKLIQVLFKVRHIAVSSIFASRKLAKFKESDKKIMETALYRLIEEGLVELVETEFGGGTKYYSVKPVHGLVRTKFKKRDNPFYENDVKGMKKREEAVKQGVVVNDLVKIKRKGRIDDEE